MGKEENPWKILSSSKVYENPWISLTEHQVIDPGGNPGIYGVVHFKNRAIGIVPYEKGYLWLVGQYRFAMDEYSWEIPEGGGSPDVENEASALRELKEETGFSAEKLELILRMSLSNSVSDERGYVYLATGLTAGEAEPDETEELRLKKISLEEAYAWVESGKITDSLSVATIYKLMLMKHEGRLPD